MELITKFFLGYLAGLSVGVYCLSLCLPVFLPVLLSQKRTTKKSFLLVLEFSAGRLLGYLFFGFIFGFLGQVIKSNFIYYVMSLANIWMGILMIFYSLGAIDKKFCAAVPFAKIKWLFLLGFLTGVNICPPFLASLTYVFNLKDVLASVFYFFMFFLGTTTYIVPAAILGIFSKYKWMLKVAQISGVLVGIYFVVKNVVSVW